MFRLSLFATSLATLALSLSPAMLAPQQQEAAPAAPPPDPNQTLCASLIAQTNTIEIGGFPPDQLMQMAHGTSAADLSMLAGKSSDRGQHYEACVNYALSAAAYLAAGAKGARSNTSTAMSMAAIEQKLGDGKKLSFTEKMLRGTARVSAVVGAMAPTPAAGAAPANGQPVYGGGTYPAATQAPAGSAPPASGPPAGCDKPPCL